VAAIALLVVLGLAVSAGALSHCPMFGPAARGPLAPFLLSYVPPNACLVLQQPPAGIPVTDAG
jgi:hypothetical protein